MTYYSQPYSSIWATRPYVGSYKAQERPTSWTRIYRRRTSNPMGAIEAVSATASHITPEFLAPSGGQALEPSGWQRHDEHRHRRDDAPKDHHPVSRESLGESANDRHETDDQDAVDRPQPAYRRARAQFPDPEGWKDVVHLHENQF